MIKFSSIIYLAFIPNGNTKATEQIYCDKLLGEVTYKKHTREFPETFFGTGN